VTNSSSTILVTGATRGCGRALVERFVESGHTIVGCGRSESHVAELRKQFGSPHRFDVVDVGSDADVAKWAKSVIDARLVPDLLLNNAAVMNEPAPLWQIPAGEFDSLLRVNVSGVANVIRHFVPAMIERRRGVIVNFSSGWGRSTSPDVAPYCASKYAIEGMSLALAQELPTGMASIPLNPGIINTEMLQTCWSDGASRFPTPSHWSQTAAPFLLSLGPKHNGQSLSVPG
jgi:NAD(P)-dependent dehydrogenase (short-subunit alcohol dehydrogenase family)